MKAYQKQKLMLIAVISLSSTEAGFGFSSYLTSWRSVYPTSSSEDSVGCAMCHVSTGGGNPWNAYGWSIRQALNQSPAPTITVAIQSVEANDADGDGSSNLIEIQANTLPGWTKGNNNSHYFKDGTITTRQLPVVTTTGLDPRKIIAWILGQGLSGTDALEGADPDKDGATNLEEYLYGGLPKNPASSPKPVIAANGGTNPTFTVDVRTNDPEFVITPKWSQNLTAFFNSGFTTPVNGTSVFGSAYVRRTYTTSLGPVSSIFFRMEGALVTP